MPSESSSSSRRSSLWEWSQAVLLAANLAWTTLCLGGYGAETMPVTVGLTAAMVVVHAFERAFAGRVARGEADDEAETNGIRALHPAGWMFVPFLVYALGNALWIAPARWLGWADWLRWAQMFAVFWVVLNGIRSSAARRVVLWTLVALGVVGVLLACYQKFVDADWLMLGQTLAPQYAGRATGSFGAPNRFAALLLLVLPMSVLLAARARATAVERVWWGWAAGVLGLGLVLTVSRGAWIGLALAGTSWPLLNVRWRWRRRMLAMVAVAVGMIAVSAALYWASAEVRDRATRLLIDRGDKARPAIWSGAWALLRDEPWTGTGAGSFNMLFERHRPEGFRDEPQWAHNEYLNTLSDYGAIGGVLLLGAVVVVALGCLRAEARDERRRRRGVDAREATVGLAIGLLAFAVHMLVDFHLKVPALGMAFAAASGMVVGRLWRAPRRRRLDREEESARRLTTIGAGAAALVACGAAAGGWIAIGWYRAEAARVEGRKIIETIAKESPAPAEQRRRLETASAWLKRAVALHPANGAAWADLAYATALFSRVEENRDAEFGREAEAAAERALTCAGGNYEYWIRRGVGRAMQARWAEADTDFAEAVKLAPRNALAWYYQAENFSRRRETKQLAQISLVFCLRLDPWNASGLALRQRLAVGVKAR